MTDYRCIEDRFLHCHYLPVAMEKVKGKIFEIMVCSFEAIKDSPLDYGRVYYHFDFHIAFCQPSPLSDAHYQIKIKDIPKYTPSHFPSWHITCLMVNYS